MREPKNPSPDNSVAICKLIEAYDQCGCLGGDAFRHAFNSAINALRASHVHVPEISQAHMRWLSGLFLLGHQWERILQRLETFKNEGE